MPVRNASQFRAVNRRLDDASSLLALVVAARYGITSPYFRGYITDLKAPVFRRLSAVRAAKKRQWNAVRNNNTSSNGGSSGSGGSGGDNSNDGWWPPGVPSTYTGPRCYEPGGVIWYPC